MILTVLTLALCSITDGDTIRCGDERIRLMSIDTPELHSPKCPQEALQAAEARDRLRELLSGGFTVERHGKDVYRRTLAVVRVNGRDVGEQLVAEKLARRWTGRREPWCLGE